MDSAPAAAPISPGKSRLLRARLYLRGIFRRALGIQDDPVLERLRAVSFRQRMFNFLGLPVGIAVAVLLYVLVEIGADRLWEFAPATRQVLLHLALWSGATLVAGCVVLVLFRRLNLLYFARAVDRVLGFDDEALVTYVDLQRRRQLSESEREISALLREEAVARLQRVDSDQLVSTRLLTALLWGLCGASGLLFALYLFCGENFSDSLYRCVMPWRDIAPPRSVKIVEVLPGDALVASGEPVKFAISVRGVTLPENATLVYHSPGEPPIDEVLGKTNRAKYEKELPGFLRSVTYWVRCQDAERGPFKLTVVERPLVTAVHVRVQPPAYASFAPAREVAGGHVQAIVGSRLEISATVNKPPKKDLPVNAGPAAWLQVGASKIPMAADNSVLKAAVALENDFEYQVRYVDTDGLASREGVQYKAKAVPDRAPKVSLERADGESTPVPRNASVLLNAEASDDLGIARLALHVRREGRPFDKLEPLDLTPATPRAEIALPVPLDLCRLDVAPGDVLLCVLQAEDVKSPARQKAETPPLRIVVALPVEKTEPPKTTPEQVADLVVAKRETKPEKTPSVSPPFEGGEKKDKPAEQPKPDADKRANDADDENKSDIDKLSEREEQLLKELADALEKLANDAERQEKLDDMADQQQQLADELAQLINEQEQNAGEEGTQESKAGDPNSPAEQPKNGEGDKGQKSQPPSEKNSQNGDSQQGQGEQKGKESGGQKNGGSQQGEGDQPGKGSGPEGDANNGQGDQGKGKGDGGSGAGKGEGEGAGKGAADGQGNGEGQGQGDGTGKGQGDGKGQGNGKEQGNGSGSGQGNQGNGSGSDRGNGQGQGDGRGEGGGNSEKDGGAKNDGAAGGGAKSGSGKSSNDGGSGSPGGGGGGGGSQKNDTPKKSGSDDPYKQAQNRMSEIARQLRRGELNSAELKRAQDALDRLFKSGRAFTEQDRERMRSRADRKNELADRGKLGPGRFNETLGRARDELSDGAGRTSGLIKNRPGELKEDELRRNIDARKAEIAPEYRKALEDFYKAVSQ